ncbi:MAG: UDP-N-acetylglucosamine 2-epimerase (hydrolyzing) [Rickettsiales bacterium]|nr:UDP-N-acetylglucosamine 2-epimerase (hydrolyzing) [Rickettsiales bacterium]
MSVSKKIKIFAFTGTRADYPRIKSVLNLIRKNSKFELKIVVTGSHLLKSSGYTYKDILKDDFKIDYKVKMFKENQTDSLGENALSFSRCSKGLVRIIEREKPDYAIVTVDRVETLAIASICALMNIPILHFQGGEISGTIDESIRHAVSKLSHFHFVSTPNSKKRLIQMGEQPKNVFLVGCPYTDILKAVMEKKTNNSEKYCIFIMHSVTTNLDEASKLFISVYNALENIAKYFKVYCFTPNTDPGFKNILNKLKKNKKFILVKNLESDSFLKLLKHAKFMIGNSSSGIREAASFKVPTIDIGSRQNGREKSLNVINVGFREDEILRKVKYVTTNSHFLKKLKNCENIYGDGNVAKKVLKILLNLKLDKTVLEKKIL